MSPTPPQAWLGPRTRVRGICLLPLTILACQNESKVSPTRERSEVVQASGSNAPPIPSPVRPAALPADEAGTRRLCDGQLAKTGRDLPRKNLAPKMALDGRIVA